MQENDSNEAVIKEEQFENCYMEQQVENNFNKKETKRVIFVNYLTNEISWLKAYVRLLIIEPLYNEHTFDRIGTTSKTNKNKLETSTRSFLPDYLKDVKNNSISEPSYFWIPKMILSPSLVISIILEQIREFFSEQENMEENASTVNNTMNEKETQEKLIENKKHKDFCAKCHRHHWKESNINFKNGDFNDEKLQSLEKSTIEKIKTCNKSRENNSTRLLILYDTGMCKSVIKMAERRISVGNLSNIIICIPRSFLHRYNSKTINPFLLTQIMSITISYNLACILEEVKRIYKQEEQASENKIKNENQLKQLLDVQELIEIKHRYKNVIEGKPEKHKVGAFSKSRYIKATCLWATCPCHKQENSLNESLRNLPSDPLECNPQFVDEEFTHQILSWASTKFKCAPSLRSSCKMIATSNFLYIFGGSNPNISKKALQDVYRFNILTRRWKQIKINNLPTSLISYSICWDPNPDGDNLCGYLFGGANDPKGLTMSNKLYKFQIDPEGAITFQEMYINGRKPTPRCGSSMVMTNEGKLYLIDGVDHKCYLSEIWILDTEAKIEKLEWKRIEQVYNLKGRYTHEAMLMDETILLLGGGNGDWSAPFDKIDAIDIKTQKYIQIQTLPDVNHGYPHERKFHSSVKHRNDVYIIGGWSDNQVSSSNIEENATIYDDIWKLSLIISEGNKIYMWTKTSSNLKMALFFHTSAITPEGCVYTFGGCIDAKSMYPSNKLQRFWIQPPELKQIAAFKLLIKNKHLVEEFKKREIKRLKEVASTSKNLENTMQESNIEESGQEEELPEEIEQNLRELLQTDPGRMFCS